MTYVIVESKNLSGVERQKPRTVVKTLGGPLKLTIEHLGGHGHYQLGSVTNALGAAGGDVLPDGTTPGQRELVIAKLSQIVFDLTKKLDDILAGKLSLSAVFTSALPQQTAAARSLVQRARDSLTGTAQLDGLLPAASRALRDYSRNINEIQSSIEGALANLEASVQGSLNVAEKARFSSVFGEAKEQAKKFVKGAAEDIPDALPWYVSAGLGLVGLAYVYNTFTRR